MVAASSKLINKNKKMPVVYVINGFILVAIEAV